MKRSILFSFSFILCAGFLLCQAAKEARADIVYYNSASGGLTLTTNYGDTSDLTISSPVANHLRIVEQSGVDFTLMGDYFTGFTLSFSFGGAPQLDIDLSMAPIEALTVNLGDGADSLILSAIVTSYPYNVDGGNGSDTLNVVSLPGELSDQGNSILSNGNTVIYYSDFETIVIPATDPDPGTPVPEPSTLLLLGSGLVGLVGYGRKRLRR